MIGRENSCHHLNQSNATLKLVPAWSLVFSRVLSRLPVFTLSSHWLTMMSTFALIGLLVYRHSIQNFSHSKTIHPFSQGIYPSVFLKDESIHIVQRYHVLKKELCLLYCFSFFPFRASRLLRQYSFIQIRIWKCDFRCVDEAMKALCCYILTCCTSSYITASFFSSPGKTKKTNHLNSLRWNVSVFVSIKDVARGAGDR